MAEVNGQLVTCDRCGTQIFRKVIGEGELDGGYTRWNKFEPCPEGWELSKIPKNDSCKDGYIKTCPTCTNL